MIHLKYTSEEGPQKESKIHLFSVIVYVLI